jgi:hypothetical protein
LGGEVQHKGPMVEVKKQEGTRRQTTQKRVKSPHVQQQSTGTLLFYVFFYKTIL